MGEEEELSREGQHQQTQVCLKHSTKGFYHGLPKFAEYILGTFSGIIIRRKRSAKRRVRRSPQVASFSFSFHQNLPQVLRAGRSPQDSETVTSANGSSAVIRDQNRSNTSQPKSLRNQEKAQAEDKTVHVEGGKARTVTKESWTQTDSLPLRDQFTQVEEEEQQSRVARWLACRVVEESLREVVEEEEERGVRRTEEEEGRALGIKGSFGKEETVGARKVKWAGNMW